MTSWPASAEWRYVPRGWTAPESGYWGTEADGRDTLKALETYRGEADAWKRGFEAIQDENARFREEIMARYATLEGAVERERAGWKREIRKARAPGFGVFAGYGLNDHGGGDFVIGAGIVWRLW